MSSAWSRDPVSRYARRTSARRWSRKICSMAGAGPAFSSLTAVYVAGAGRFVAGSVAVPRPVPGLRGQVVEAEARGVGLEPVEGGAPPADGPTADGEVDRQALLVLGRARRGRGRRAGRRGCLVDGVVAGAAVGPTHRHLVGRVAVAA